jgi:glycosyltransferase involved in cell wall biosynthesis
VIRVAFDLRDPVRSGIARVATSTLKAFLGIAPNRFRVVVAGPPGALAELGVDQWGDVTIVPFKAARYALAAEIEWPGVRAAAGDATWFFPHFDIPLRAGGERYVTVAHDIAHFDGPAAHVLKGLVARRWMRRSIFRSAITHTPSQFTARRLAATWPDVAEKLRVVPNGVDGQFFDSAGVQLPEHVRSWVGDRRYMLSVGNLKRHKNLAVGVDLLAAIPDLAWIVAGERFADWSAVEVRAREVGVGERILVLPRENDNTLRSLYASSAFLFFPSLYEGFGLPVLEAMAAGTLVVASEATSVPEVLGDCGWLCNPMESAEFIIAAREALGLSSLERSRRVLQSRERARSFSWERCATALADSIEEIARSRSLSR